MTKGEGCAAKRIDEGFLLSAFKDLLEVVSSVDSENRVFKDREWDGSGASTRCRPIVEGPDWRRSEVSDNRDSVIGSRD